MKTAPISPVRNEQGTVRLITHTAPHYEQALVDSVLSDSPEGSVVILTQTNEAGLRILGLLGTRGIRARLIQSLDGFRLLDLAEFRCFLHHLDPEGSRILYTREEFAQARSALQQQYERSQVLAGCLRCLDRFQSVNNRLYRSDLLEFLRESQLEDFYGEDQERILISTIHKAKGKEFDHVYLLLTQRPQAPEDQRAVYVGMTRARNTLTVHMGTGMLPIPRLPGITSSIDHVVYPETDLLQYQLSHRDVVLDFFKGRRHDDLALQSGMALEIESEYLVFNGRRVAKFSRRFLDFLRGMEQRELVPVRASVRYCVYWHARDEQEEYEILLPLITLQRRQDGTQSDQKDPVPM